MIRILIAKYLIYPGLVTEDRPSGPNSETKHFTARTTVKARKTSIMEQQSGKLPIVHTENN